MSPLPTVSTADPCIFASVRSVSPPRSAQRGRGVDIPSVEGQSCHMLFESDLPKYLLAK